MLYQKNKKLMPKQSKKKQRQEIKLKPAQQMHQRKLKLRVTTARRIRRKIKGSERDILD